jgi:hypothetical protein
LEHVRLASPPVGALVVGQFELNDR